MRGLYQLVKALKGKRAAAPAPAPAAPLAPAPPFERQSPQVEIWRHILSTRPHPPPAAPEVLRLQQDAATATVETGIRGL
jgi:hypothetical protein